METLSQCPTNSFPTRTKLSVNLLGEGVAARVLDIESVAPEELRAREPRHAIKYPRVLDQVAAQPELVVALDPGDPRPREDTPERDQDLPSVGDLFTKLPAAAG